MTPNLHRHECSECGLKFECDDPRCKFVDKVICLACLEEMDQEETDEEVN